MDAENDEIWQRIAKIRQHFCDGNNILFAEKLGKDTTYTSQLCNGTKTSGKKILELILATFPSVSRGWLYFGEGGMLTSSAPASEGRAKAEWREGEPSLLELYTAVVRENERLRMENERLRKKLVSLSERTGEAVI